MKLRFEDRARRELFRAFDYLEGQRPGHGKKFLDEVQARLALIKADPFSRRDLGNGTRRHILKALPVLRLLQGCSRRGHNFCRGAPKA